MGPFGLLMMKSLNVAAIFREAVLENTALMNTLTSLLHSKSFNLLDFGFLFYFALLSFAASLCMLVLPTFSFS